jgi:hypothetical protein
MYVCVYPDDVFWKQGFGTSEHPNQKFVQDTGPHPSKYLFKITYSVS